MFIKRNCPKLKLSDIWPICGKLPYRNHVQSKSKAEKQKLTGAAAR